MREPDLEREHPVGMGIQKIYRFANGYGASVIMFKIEMPKILSDAPELEPFAEHIREHPVGSYGVGADLWELAVIHFHDEELLHFELDSTTPITNDVLGYLTDEEVEEVLDKIEALPDRVASQPERSTNGKEAS